MLVGGSEACSVCEHGNCVFLSNMWHVTLVDVDPAFAAASE